MYAYREDFTTFADVCFREFGDKVKHWTTVNKGNAYAIFGYDLGISPPQRSKVKRPQAAHYRRTFPWDVDVTISPECFKGARDQGSPLPFSG